MLSLDSHPSGRHFLQIPGPSPVPDRILRALSLPTIDHRGPEFAVLGKTVIAGLQQVFQTRHPVAIYPASGTGAWEAALVNVLSPGDAVLMIGAGVITAVPLMLYANGAKRLRLTTIALMQYIAPTFVFLCAVLVFGESFDGGKRIAFPLIWAALALYSVDLLRRRR